MFAPFRDSSPIVNGQGHNGQNGAIHGKRPEAGPAGGGDQPFKGRDANEQGRNQAGQGRGQQNGALPDLAQVGEEFQARGSANGQDAQEHTVLNGPPAPQPKDQDRSTDRRTAA